MNAVRLVLDSNVIISAFLFGGPPARLIQLAVDGSAECFTSLPILDEVREVLQRPKFGLSSEQALTLVEEVHDLCTVVTPTRRVRAVKDDPDDNMVLECALAAQADVIASGDAHLLGLGSWRQVRILPATNVIKEIEARRKALPD